MIEWPKHNETIRADELFLFAYCVYRWRDEPYVSRSPEQYTDVVTRLNDRFRVRFGKYTIDGVQSYLRRLRSDPKYRIPPHAHKRYNHFATEIEQYRASHRREFGPSTPHRPIDIAQKGTCSARCVGV
jgi:hypothetical protein